MAVVEGVPSGLPVTAEGINVDLIRRQGGYGRGGRMRIEKDRIEFICGVRKGKTLGNPLGLLIWNKDWENWKDIMASEPGPPSTERVVTVHGRAMQIWLEPSNMVIAIFAMC